MAVLEILTHPNKILRNKTHPIEQVDGHLQTLIDDMAATMYHAPGVGLAAIQVGHDISMLVYDIAPNNEERQLHVLINPTIVSKEGEVLSENEGCLSVPDFRANVKRASRILVEGLDRNGNPQRIEAEGMLAIVLQHEMDHLNGTLFIDHISALKRNLYNRRIKKKMKNQASS